jgi:RNAse (barnase) inhibitor barstar
MLVKSRKKATQKSDAINITKNEIIVCTISAVFRTLKEDKKKKDALFDILMKLVENNPANLHFMDVQSTDTLNQSQQMQQVLLLVETSDIVPQIVQEAPPYAATGGCRETSNIRLSFRNTSISITHSVITFLNTNRLM